MPRYTVTAETNDWDGSPRKMRRGVGAPNATRAVVAALTVCRDGGHTFNGCGVVATRDDGKVLVFTADFDFGTLTVEPVLSCTAGYTLADGVSFAWVCAACARGKARIIAEGEALTHVEDADPVECIFCGAEAPRKE